MREHSFTGKQRCIKELRGAEAEITCLQISPLAKQQKCLVKVKEPRPNDVLFLGKHFSSLSKSPERLKRFTLFPICDRLVRKRLCSFISHAKLLELAKALVRRQPCLAYEIQLKINV